MAKAFKVALNPRNPEAAAWYDKETGVNLFLGEVTDRSGQKVGGPISHDISNYNERQLKNVIRGINAGHLIVVEGEIPTGVSLEGIPNMNAPRSRWARDEDERGQPKPGSSDKEKAALESWDELVYEKNKAKQETKTAAK